MSPTSPPAEQIIAVMRGAGEFGLAWHGKQTVDPADAAIVVKADPADPPVPLVPEGCCHCPHCQLPTSANVTISNVTPTIICNRSMDPESCPGKECGGGGSGSGSDNPGCTAPRCQGCEGFNGSWNIPLGTPVSDQPCVSGDVLANSLSDCTTQDLNCPWNCSGGDWILTVEVCCEMVEGGPQYTISASLVGPDGSDVEPCKACGYFGGGGSQVVNGDLSGYVDFYVGGSACGSGRMRVSF